MAGRYEGILGYVLIIQAPSIYEMQQAYTHSPGPAPRYMSMKVTTLLFF
jgi:hypothetical protein